MKADKFIKLKPKSRLPLEPEVQPRPDPEVETQPRIEAESLIQLNLPLESLVQSTPNSESELELELELELESDPELVESIEPLAMTYKGEALFGSGWRYSELLKEFRE